MADLELAMQSPDFWTDHQKASQVAKELTSLKEEVEFWEAFEEKLSTESDLPKLKEQFDKQYINIFLSGKYDHNNALLAIHSGAGGEDAADWARMLFDMYRKYCERAGFGFLILDDLTAEVTGRRRTLATGINRGATLTDALTGRRAGANAA